MLQQFYDDKNDFFYGLRHVFGLKRLTTAKGIVETEKKISSCYPISLRAAILPIIPKPDLVGGRFLRINQVVDCVEHHAHHVKCQDSQM